MSEEERDVIVEALELVERLPGPAIAAVFHRYGKPLEGELPHVEVYPRTVAIALDDGRAATVRVLRVRMPVDVIGNDWFVLDSNGADRMAVAGPLFAAAIAALSRKLRIA